MKSCHTCTHYIAKVKSTHWGILGLCSAQKRHGQTLFKYQSDGKHCTHHILKSSNHKVMEENEFLKLIALQSIKVRDNQKAYFQSNNDYEILKRAKESERKLDRMLSDYKDESYRQIDLFLRSPEERYL